MNRIYAKSRKPPRIPKVRMPEGSLKTVAVFGVALVFSLIGYISEVSSTSSKGYDIRTLQKDIATLKDESARAEFQLAQGQSVAAVEEKVRALGMVPTDRIDYIVPGTPVVARR